MVDGSLRKALNYYLKIRLEKDPHVGLVLKSEFTIRSSCLDY